MNAHPFCRYLLILPVATLLLGACEDSPVNEQTLLRPLTSVGAANSAEPHLAKSPDGTVVMSWLEPDGGDTTLRFSTLGPSGWTPPATVARGDNWFVNWADFPSVEPISNDHWAAHWLVKREGNAYAYDIAVSQSSDQGRSWSEAITPHRDGTATEHGFVSLYPSSDGVGLLWLDGRNMANHEDADVPLEESGMTLRSALLTKESTLLSEQVADGLVCDCCQTDVALGSQGAIAVYRDRSVDEIRDIYVTRLTDGRWSVGQPVARDNWEIAGCPVNGPAVASRGDEVAIAWFTAANDRPAVRFSRSGDGAETFGDAIDIDVEQAIGRVDVELLDDGFALVSWLQENAADDAASVVVASISPKGDVGPTQIIASTAASRRSGFPQMRVGGDNVVIAWTDVSNGQTQVLSALIKTEALLSRK